MVAGSGGRDDSECAGLGLGFRTGFRTGSRTPLVQGQQLHELLQLHALLQLHETHYVQAGLWA
jgi:hypothetical protein